MQKKDDFCSIHSELFCAGAIFLMINAVVTIIYFLNIIADIASGTWSEIVLLGVAVCLGIIVLETAALFSGYNILLKRSNQWRIFALIYLYLKTLFCLIMFFFVFAWQVDIKSVCCAAGVLLLFAATIIVLHLPAIKKQFIPVTGEKGK